MATVTSFPFDIPLWWQRLREAPLSLKRQCLRSIALVSACTWLIVTGVIVMLAQHQADAMFDTSLREMAHLALSFADHELEEIRDAGGGNVSDDIDEAFAGRFVYQVWQPGHVLAYRSANAPEHAPLHLGESGLTHITYRGQTLRAYTTWNRIKSFQIQMAAFPEPRERYSARISLALCLGLLAALGAFLFIIRRQLDRAFAPLHDTAHALSRKSVIDLSPVGLGQQPAELLPVIRAFNDLMRRMSLSLRHEQRFTSDAAHELRTPLASLKILVRNAQRARNEAEREEALAQMGLSIDRATALVGQLLALARYDRDPSHVALDEQVNLLELTHTVLGDLHALATERGVTPELSGTPDDAVVRGNRDALAMAMRNLIENALRHGPAGARLVIDTQRDTHTGEVQWQVHDSGPGVPPELRERVFARFFRLNRNTSQGTGLGLAIARRIVEIHHGVVSVGQSALLGGAAVHIRLPHGG